MKPILICCNGNRHRFVRRLAQHLDRDGLKIWPHKDAIAVNDLSLNDIRATVNTLREACCIFIPNFADITWRNFERHWFANRTTDAGYKKAVIFFISANYAQRIVGTRAFSFGCQTIDSLDSQYTRIRDCILRQSWLRSPSPKRRPKTTRHLSGLSTKTFLFVIGRPGAGKTTFCKFLHECAAARGANLEICSDYQFLRKLFLSDCAKGLTKRFSVDQTSEFIVKDLSVFQETLKCMRDYAILRKMPSYTRRVLELSLPRYDSVFLDYLIKGVVDGVIVHVHAPLLECKARNEFRREILQRRLSSAKTGNVVFAKNPDLHYVPQSAYSQYETVKSVDASGCHEKSLLSLITSGAYFRLENSADSLGKYRQRSIAFIENCIFPLMFSQID